MERPSRPNTQNINRIVYSDFKNNLDFHPVTNNLLRVTNKDSVNQALRNLILTNTMERLYNPQMGSDIYRSLFESVIYDEDKYLLKNKIMDNIRAYEPRVDLIDVEILLQTDIGKLNNTVTGRVLDIRDFGGKEENALMINIIYRIINTNEQLSLNVILERSR